MGGTVAKSLAAILPGSLRTAEGKSDSRRKLMGAVRAACNRQGISDEDRRAIQEEVTGKASLKDMSLREIGQVLDRLNAGWKGPMGHRAHVAKIRALWWTLYWLGEIEEPNDRALEAFILRQSGIARLNFLDHRAAWSVIEALKSWLARKGVKWLTDGEIAPPITRAQADRHAVLYALWAKLRVIGVVRADRYPEYLCAALKLNQDHLSWTDHQLDAAIRHLGKMLRRALGRQVD